MRPETGRDELWLQAAEYVCGLASLTERRELAALAGRDATFNAMVGEWERQMARLNRHHVPEAAPDVWPFLDRSLFAARRRRAWLLRLGVLAVAVAVAAKVALIRLML